MFLKIFFVKLHVVDIALLLGWERQDWVALFVMLQALVYSPPPSMLLEKLNHERRIVTFSNKTSVKLELRPLKI